MECELLLPVAKKAGYSKAQLDNEVMLVQQLVPYFISYTAFVNHFEVVNTQKRKWVTKKHHKMPIYREGVRKKPFVFVIAHN